MGRMSMMSVTSADALVRYGFLSRARADRVVFCHVNQMTEDDKTALLVTINNLAVALETSLSQTRKQQYA